MQCCQCFPLHNGWGPNALTQSFLAQISLWKQFPVSFREPFAPSWQRKLCLVKCLENTQRMFNNVIMEGKGFHASPKNWKKILHLQLGVISSFFIRGIFMDIKCPCNQSFFLSESSHFIFFDLKHMISTHSKGFCEKNCPKFARFQF
jgi:hypothetical protein